MTTADERSSLMVIGDRQPHDDETMLHDESTSSLVPYKVVWRAAFMTLAFCVVWFFMDHTQERRRHNSYPNTVGEESRIGFVHLTSQFLSKGRIHSNGSLPSVFGQVVQQLSPLPTNRCEWVLEQFAERDGWVRNGLPDPDLNDAYYAQSVDENVFYRATAHIFWVDFVHNHWGDDVTSLLQGEGAVLKGGVPITSKSAYTWITGDQVRIHTRQKQRSRVFFVHSLEMGFLGGYSAFI